MVAVDYKWKTEGKTIYNPIIKKNALSPSLACHCEQVYNFTLAKQIW